MTEADCGITGCVLAPGHAGEHRDLSEFGQSARLASGAASGVGSGRDRLDGRLETPTADQPQGLQPAASQERETLRRFAQDVHEIMAASEHSPKCGGTHLMGYGSCQHIAAGLTARGYAAPPRPAPVDGELARLREAAEELIAARDWLEAEVAAAEQSGRSLSTAPHMRLIAAEKALRAALAAAPAAPAAPLDVDVLATALVATYETSEGPIRFGLLYPDGGVARLDASAPVLAEAIAAAYAAALRARDGA